MKPILLSTALVLTPFMAGAATVVLDDFTTRQVVADEPNGDVATSSEVAGSTILGGYRELAAQTLNTGGLFATKLDVADDGRNLLSFSNASDQAGIGTVTYDGEGSSGLGGYDLAGQGSIFEFAVENADAMFTLASTVRDTSGATSTFEETYPQSIEGGTIDLAFADFDGGADFSSVDSIMFTFSGPQDLDASFGQIALTGPITPPAPIPVPAGAVLLGSALLGFGALRRRKA